MYASSKFGYTARISGPAARYEPDDGGDGNAQAAMQGLRFTLAPREILLLGVIMVLPSQSRHVDAVSKMSPRQRWKSEDAGEHQRTRETC